MKIGVLAFVTEQSGEAGIIARRAEVLGFKSFWVPEHLIIHVQYTPVIRVLLTGKFH